MKKLLLFTLIGTVAGVLGAADKDAKTESKAEAKVEVKADAKSEIKSATKKLAEKPNYSWTSTPKSEGAGANFRQGPTEGKTEKGGYTFYKLTFGDNDVEAAFKGAKSAIKWESDWQSADDLDGDNAWIARRLKAFKAPAGEAEDLAAKTKDVKKGEGGLYSGDLTEDGLKELLTRRGAQAREPKDAKGWVKFWVKDGLLAKYVFNVQGKIIGRDDQEIEINRTTTVEIKDIGSTKVEVPAEAKKKLE